MKKKILILSGGISKERLISLDTGLQVAKELKKNGYKIKISEPDNNLEKNIKLFKPAIIFNALHGQFGEDGYIQTILEQFKIPYTHSGVIASSIAMDKEVMHIRDMLIPKFSELIYNGFYIMWVGPSITRFSSHADHSAHCASCHVQMQRAVTVIFTLIYGCNAAVVEAKILSIFCY